MNCQVDHIMSEKQILAKLQHPFIVNMSHPLLLHLPTLYAWPNTVDACKVWLFSRSALHLHGPGAIILRIACEAMISGRLLSGRQFSCRYIVGGEFFTHLRKAMIQTAISTICACRLSLASGWTFRQRAVAFLRSADHMHFRVPKGYRGKLNPSLSAIAS